MYNTVLDLVGLISFSTPMHDTSTSFIIRAHCSELFISENNQRTWIKMYSHHSNMLFVHLKKNWILLKM